MKHVAETQHRKLEDLYKQFGWPLYKKFGHAFDAFKIAIQYVPSICSAYSLQH
jgi:translation initiation factor 2 subunit 1